VAIRPVDASRDAADCTAIYAPFVTGGATSFEETPPSPDEMARRIAAYTATHPWIVEERDGHAVGYAYATRFSGRAAYRWAAEVAVYVHPEHHRGGVGRRLYTALFERLRLQGVRTVCAGVTLPNPASVGLHESLGFRPVGVFRRVGWKRGAWHDVGWWQLDLGGPDGPPPEPGPPAP
jgi:L-amino acid N-acyltransferase YncA